MQVGAVESGLVQCCLLVAVGLGSLQLHRKEEAGVTVLEKSVMLATAGKVLLAVILEAKWKATFE